MKRLTLNFSHAYQLFDFDRIDKALDRGERDAAYNFMLSDLDNMKRLLVHLKHNNFDIVSVDAGSLCFESDSATNIECLKSDLQG